MTSKYKKSDWSATREDEKDCFHVIAVGQLVFRFVAVDDQNYKVEVWGNRDRERAELFAEFKAEKFSSLKALYVPAHNSELISL